MHTKGYLEDVSFISSKMFAKFLLINLLIILDIIFSCLFTYSEESHLVFAGSVLYRHTESEMLFKLASDLGKFFSVSILTYYLLIGLSRNHIFYHPCTLPAQNNNPSPKVTAFVLLVNTHCGN